MSCFKIGATIFVFLALAAFVWASEADELREKAKAMQREVAELAEHGHHQEAANLKRKAMAMLEEAERLEHHRPDEHKAEIMELEEQLRMLLLEERKLKETGGKRERLADVRREVEVIRDRLTLMLRESHNAHDVPHEEITRRLEHMRIAVDHLHQAGLHDIAEHVAERAEATERELRERHGHHEGDVMREVMKQLEEIRHEVGRLRDEVNEIREKR